MYGHGIVPEFTKPYYRRAMMPLPSTIMGSIQLVGNSISRSFRDSMNIEKQQRTDIMFCMSVSEKRIVFVKTRSHSTSQIIPKELCNRSSYCFDTLGFLLRILYRIVGRRMKRFNVSLFYLLEFTRVELGML